MFNMEVYFLELGIVLIVVSVLGLIFKTIRQPLILAYIATGFILGPLFFKVIINKELIATFSSIGITFLLFLVGLELDLRKLKKIGKVSVIVSLGHFIIAGALGFLIAYLFGISIITSLYIALALTLSSTVIVVKLLSETHETNSLHGKIAIGFLIVQDILAIITLIFLDVLKTQETIILMPFLTVFIKAAFLILVAFLISSYILPSVFRYIAKYQEMLFVLSIAWCFLFAIVAYYLGLSIEIGAFLAGLSLAYLPYSFEIVARVKSLRDFFLIIFFVALGSQISFNASDGLSMIIVLSLFVLVIQPIIVMALLGFLGYSKRTSFLAGISIAQVSEFSLIILGTGFALGHISQETISMVTIVAIITITISTYFLTFGKKLYNVLRKYLVIFERKNPHEHYTPVELKVGNHIILVGCRNIGGRLLEALLAMKKKVIVVDFDPDIIAHLNNRQVPCIYGDVEDADIAEKIGLSKASMVISTVPDLKDNLLLIRRTKRLNPDVIVIVATYETVEAFELYHAGADYVILPDILGGEHSSLLIQKLDKDRNQIKQLKDSHMKDLRKRVITYVHHSHKGFPR